MPRKKDPCPNKSNAVSYQEALLGPSSSQHDLTVINDETSDIQHKLNGEDSYFKRFEKKDVSKRKKKKSNQVTDGVLQEYLDHCTYFLSVINMISPSNINRKVSPHFLGHISITLPTSQYFLTLHDVPEIYLYVSPSPEKCLVYVEHSSGVFYWPVTCSTPYDVLTCLRNKQLFCLHLMSDAQECSSHQLSISIHILDSGFINLKYSSDPKQNRSFISVFKHFTSLTLPELSSTSDRPAWPHQNTQELYDCLRTLTLKYDAVPRTIPLHDLLPSLRPYQEEAVQWMLSREEIACTQDALHCLFEEFCLPSGQMVYINKYSGILSLKKPLCVQSSPGGILADEMGLGKTVEVLACIISHPRPVDFLEQVKTKPSQDKPDLIECVTSNSGVCVPKNMECGVSLKNQESNIDFNNLDDKFSSGFLVNGTTHSVIDTKSDTNNSNCLESRKRKRLSSSASLSSHLSDNDTIIDSSDSENTIGYSMVSYGSDPEDETINVSRSESRNSREFFECVCGCDHWRLEWVQCTFCGNFQHKQCMSFNDEMDETQYLCPHCWVSDETPLAKSRATLVVTPSSIRSQWEEEIERHLRKGSLKWMFYPGMGHQGSGFMQPLQLADHDLVLVTYETLRKEIDYVDLPHSNSDSGRRFRNPKRFMATPTPLLAVEWWRVCLDEAQMVEGVTSKTAEMALRLTAVNKWCVTGTPIQKSINDLYGLLLFLGVDPFWHKYWWDKLLYEPYRAGLAQPLLEVLKNYFWRNTKKDVLHQIGLPPQDERTHKLIFSPVEEHFYQRQYQECSQEALLRLNKFSDLHVKLRHLDKQTMAQVMFPLSKLRQACCHPQAVRGHFLPIQKTTMTMEDLLTVLIKKTKLECEESHRQFICALNGLAGIHLINEEYVEAVQKYREVLQSVKEQKDVLKTDKMQKIHTLYNLSRILKGKLSPSDSEENKEDKDVPRTLPDIGHTLEDDSLEEEYQNLREHYLRKYQGQVTTAQEQLYKARQALKEIDQQFEGEGKNWWIIGCRQMDKSGYNHELVQRAKDSLMEKKKCKDSIIDRFNTVNGLQFVLTKLLDDLLECHDTLTRQVLALSAIPSEENVTEAIRCHLRPLVKTNFKCEYCKCHALFNMYEGLLFFFEEGFEKDHSDDEESRTLKLRRGTWADNQLEAVLKAILTFIKLHKGKSGLIDNGSNHLKWFEALKKEFRALRSVWMQIRDYASALDELEMAKLRFRLRFEGELKENRTYVLEPLEVQPMKLKVMSDRILAQSEVRKKLGQLLYLQNLEKTDFDRKGGACKTVCPICQKELGTEWSVLQCGHSFCMDCIRVLILQYSVGAHRRSVRCAICREETIHAEISYVDTKAAQNSLEQEDVKGSHSTKVEAVIRCLLKIKREDPEAKSLVFSSWKSMLDVLEEALNENEIANVSFQSQKLQKTLWKFKHDPEMKVLLLPVQSGANGLNLIEATHVLMVEPLLNPAAELQALGRVHRIGQTKPTMVHRFIVCSTIEERIHRACTNNANENEDDMTLRELKQLFEEKS